MLERSRICAVVAVGAGVLLSACAAQLPTTQSANISSSSPTTSASQQDTTAPTDSAGQSNNTGSHSSPSRCTASTLKGSLAGLPGSSDNPVEGTAKLDLTNTGKSACTMRGFVGLQMINDHLEPLTTKVVRNQSSPTLVTLQPGGTAAADLTWTGGAGVQDPSNSCVPPAAAVKVIAPDDNQQIQVDVPGNNVLEVCTPDGSGSIVVSPMHN